MFWCMTYINKNRAGVKIKPQTNPMNEDRK